MTSLCCHKVMPKIVFLTVLEPLYLPSAFNSLDRRFFLREKTSRNAFLKLSLVFIEGLKSLEKHCFVVFSTFLLVSSTV